MLDAEFLEFLFSEIEGLDQTFEEWAEAHPGWEDLSDSEIIAILPDLIVGQLGDFGFNVSGGHNDLNP